MHLHFFYISNKLDYRPAISERKSHDNINNGTNSLACMMHDQTHIGTYAQMQTLTAYQYVCTQRNNNKWVKY